MKFCVSLKDGRSVVQPAEEIELDSLGTLVLKDENGKDVFVAPAGNWAVVWKVFEDED